MYESTIATHYAAYRPPLHKNILESVFAISRNRNIGLDIGCGTGCSSRALAYFCNHVIGIDPSMAMLRKAEEQNTINYINASGENIPIANSSIDVVTIAGSLNYIDRKLLTRELIRICRRTAEIAIYDFGVDLSNIETQLIPGYKNDSLNYNHSLNLSEFTEVKGIRFDSHDVMLDLMSHEVAHLLLSDNGWHSALRGKFNSQDFGGLLKAEIDSIGLRFTVKANICYSLYSLSKS